jgi:hypothetical protein
MMNRANLPVRSSAGEPRMGVPASIPNFPVVRPANPNFDPLEGRTPEDYPFLGSQQPPHPGPAPTPLSNMQGQAKSDYVRAVLARLGVERELPPL